MSNSIQKLKLSEHTSKEYHKLCVLIPLCDDIQSSKAIVYELSQICASKIIVHEFRQIDLYNHMYSHWLSKIFLGFRQNPIS